MLPLGIIKGREKKHLLWLLVETLNASSSISCWTQKPAAITFCLEELTWDVIAQSLSSVAYISLMSVLVKPVQEVPLDIHNYLRIDKALTRHIRVVREADVSSRTD